MPGKTLTTILQHWSNVQCYSAAKWFQNRFRATAPWRRGTPQFSAPTGQRDGCRVFNTSALSSGPGSVVQLARGRAVALNPLNPRYRKNVSEPRTLNTDQVVSVLQGVNAVGSDHRSTSPFSTDTFFLPQTLQSIRFDIDLIA